MATNMPTTQDYDEHDEPTSHPALLDSNIDVYRLLINIRDALKQTEILALSSGGSLLKAYQYAPSTVAVYDVAGDGSTFTNVDTTNMSFSFTVPATASGNVLLRLTAPQTSSGGGKSYWALLDHTSHTQYGQTMFIVGAAYGGTESVACIASLTPGDTYHMDWAFGADIGTTAYIEAAGFTGNVPQYYGGPAIMEAWAA